MTKAATKCHSVCKTATKTPCHTVPAPTPHCGGVQDCVPHVPVPKLCGFHFGCLTWADFLPYDGFCARRRRR